MSGTPKHLSYKELSKKFRHEAYVRAKEYRKNDPRQIAMKERIQEHGKPTANSVFPSQLF
jgi:hypothetical protein